MTITTIDPFELNNKKLEILESLIKDLLSVFSNHQLASCLLSAGQYRFFLGKPTEHKTKNDITRIHFGLLTPTPIDTRNDIIKFLFPLDAPRPKVIGSVVIDFEQKMLVVNKLQINVFGLGNKPLFEDFISKINTKYYGYMTIVREDPLELHNPITLYI